MTLKYEKSIEAAEYITNRYGGEVGSLAIVLGTGLGPFAHEVDVHSRIPYEDIPHFPTSTVESHAGEFIIGQINGHPIILMAGRFHYYEGYSTAELTFPIYVLKALGITTYLATNVTGGINPDYKAGDIVIVRDHINLHPDHPLRGPNDERLGPRFPDMMQAYHPDYIRQFEDLGKNLAIPIQKGVYVGLQGPSLETPAEYNYCRVIGGDMIGMSTVPEVIVANHCGIHVVVLSIISNVCYPLDRLTKTTVDEVIEVANQATPKLSRLVKSWITTHRP